MPHGPQKCSHGIREVPCVSRSWCPVKRGGRTEASRKERRGSVRRKEVEEGGAAAPGTGRCVHNMISRTFSSETMSSAEEDDSDDGEGRIPFVRVPHPAADRFQDVESVKLAPQTGGCSSRSRLSKSSGACASARPFLVLLAQCAARGPERAVVLRNPLPFPTHRLRVPPPDSADNSWRL